MGKNLVILGADFSANGIRVADANVVYPSFEVNTFVYDSNKKMFPHPSYKTCAYRLKKGVTYRIKTTITEHTTTPPNFKIDDICVSNIAYLFLEQSLISSSGTYIGEIDVIRTTNASTAVSAYNDTYTPTEDCTLLVSTDSRDIIEITKE